MDVREWIEGECGLASCESGCEGVDRGRVRVCE